MARFENVGNFRILNLHIFSCPTSCPPASPSPVLRHVAWLLLVFPHSFAQSHTLGTGDELLGISGVKVNVLNAILYNYEWTYDGSTATVQ